MYELTEEGRELGGSVRELGTWGQRWLPRTLPREQLDAEALLWDMRRRVRTEELPSTPVVARIEFSDARGRARVRFLLLRRSEEGMIVEGRRDWVRAFPKWFERYLFADVKPAHAEPREKAGRL